ncbi:MAG TPA: type II toxin-antitoxin system PemK/MazF family toxin [Ignavibacteria bacterium]|nr:type II toxin-antitoxin system PemK/MazF family toxin [Ignavibacteria bacterium]
MKTPLKRFDVWIADLNPPNRTEPGKIRPVVIVQSDLLNNFHPSTLVCPLTTNVIQGAEILRVNLAKNEGGLKKRSAVLVDQLRAIDNKRLMNRVGRLSKTSRERLEENLRIIMEL